MLQDASVLHKRYGILIGNMAKQKQKRPRTYARNRARRLYESDGVYFFKLVLCVVGGAIWLRFGDPVMVGGVALGAIPVGMLIGLLIVRQYEKQQSNRKIWYATLLIVGIVSNFMASGIVL